jgi:hypothetical protein
MSNGQKHPNELQLQSAPLIGTRLGPLFLFRWDATVLL